MKAESLFHLLQVRARKLEEGADPTLQRHLRAVQAELRVGHSRGWFEVTWRYEGCDYSLNVPEHDFTFYVAGDTSKAVEQRGTTGNVRQRNWQAAAALWRRLAEVSGFDMPANQDEALGLTPAPADRRASSARRFLACGIVAAVGAVAVGLHADWVLGLGSALVAFLLTSLTPSLADTQLRRPFSALEIIIVTAAAFLPGWLGGNPLWLVPLLAGLVVIAWIESAEADLPAGWALAGVLGGLSSFWLGPAAFLPVLVLGSALAILHVLAPRRLGRTDTACFLLGGVAGVIAGIILTQPTPSVSGGSMALPAVTAALLLLAFGLWSFHGMLYRLVPWLAIGTLGLAAAAAIIAGRVTADGALALAGFALVIAARVVAAFIGATTPRRSLPSKD